MYCATTHGMASTCAQHFSITDSETIGINQGQPEGEKVRWAQYVTFLTLPSSRHDTRQVLGEHGNG